MDLGYDYMADMIALAPDDASLLSEAIRCYPNGEDVFEAPHIDDEMEHYVQYYYETYSSNRPSSF